MILVLACGRMCIMEFILSILMIFTDALEIGSFLARYHVRSVNSLNKEVTKEGRQAVRKVAFLIFLGTGP